MGERIRWGILGAGGIAATVGADIAASAGSVLEAVAARDAGRAAAFAEQHVVARSYGSYVELVSDPEVDVVYVATTHAQHLEHAVLALEAGKPVLVEKAFALNAREARAIVDVARQKSLFCMEAMWMRFNPLIRRAQELVTAGAIGEVVGVRADLSRYFEYSPRHRLFDLALGGGALLDLGVYPITFAWLFLGRPHTVQATGSLSATGSDATAAIQWGYEDGRVAQMYSSAISNSPYAGLVTGTEGWIHLEDRVHHPSKMTVHTSQGDEVFTDEQPGHGYGLQVAEVERCLRAGELESPVIPLDDTIAILETIDEARRQIGVRYAADTES